MLEWNPIRILNGYWYNMNVRNEWFKPDGCIASNIQTSIYTSNLIKTCVCSIEFHTDSSVSTQLSIPSFISNRNLYPFRSTNLKWKYNIKSRLSENKRMADKIRQ